MKFDTYEERSDLVLMNTANSLVRLRGIGTIILQLPLSLGVVKAFRIKDVVYMPKAPICLFSGFKLYQRDSYLRNRKAFDKDDNKLF